mmetsp:Transcript_14118/g.29270  ORF Transcript_14118/g.29270 Transcript_14118/m.29270 type:complete len:212 (+) Transcript_14118:569-1204(+)
MMCTVITSSSCIPYPLAVVRSRSKKEALPLMTSVMRPASMESDSMSDALCRVTEELAMSFLMKRRESSSSELAEPRIRSRFATSTRSVLAVIWSQKMFWPPSTTGMLPVSLVLNCSAWSLALPVTSLPRSSAVITRSTKTLEERSAAEGGIQSMPSGTLKETNWSGMDVGLAHMDERGAQSWLMRVKKVSYMAWVNTWFPLALGSFHSMQA